MTLALPLSPLPADTSRALRLSVFFYFAHILCEGWINTSQGFLGLSIVAALLPLRNREIRLRFHPLMVPGALFVLASWMSSLTNYDPVGSLLGAHEWFNFLSFLVGLTLFRTFPRLVSTALTAFASLAVFLATYGLVQYFFLGRRDLEHRITATAAHVMTYSGILLAIVVFFTVLAVDQRKRLWVAAAGFGAAALVLTFTRGAWAGWLAGMLAFVMLRRIQWLKIAVPLLLLAILFSPLSIFSRFISSFDAAHPSNLDRIRMLQAGAEIIRDQPLFGIGPGHVKEIYPLYRAADAPRFKVPHLHNNLVQIWAERGVVAVFAYLLFVGVFIYVCLRARRDPQKRSFADAGIAIAVAMAVAGLFEFNFGDTEVLLTMIDLFAIVAFMVEKQPHEPVSAGEAIDSRFPLL